mmetsp:Transcript_5096/g.9715  ORF Transcript_5096/g.9715 Transcript_5096/m.9715 type:complete len:265 (+) Transcript_5096:162-956(+)
MPKDLNAGLCLGIQPRADNLPSHRQQHGGVDDDQIAHALREMVRVDLGDAVEELRSVPGKQPQPPVLRVDDDGELLNDAPESLRVLPAVGHVALLAPRVVVDQLLERGLLRDLPDLEVPELLVQYRPAELVVALLPLGQVLVQQRRVAAQDLFLGLRAKLLDVCLLPPLQMLDQHLVRLLNVEASSPQEAQQYQLRRLDLGIVQIAQVQLLLVHHVLQGFQGLRLLRIQTAQIPVLPLEIGVIRELLGVHRGCCCPSFVGSIRT